MVDKSRFTRGTCDHVLISHKPHNINLGKHRKKRLPVLRRNKPKSRGERSTDGSAQLTESLCANPASFHALVVHEGKADDNTHEGFGRKFFTAKTSAMSCSAVHLWLVRKILGGVKQDSAKRE